MRDLRSNDVETAAQLARDDEPPDVERPAPPEYADLEPRRGVGAMRRSASADEVAKQRAARAARGGGQPGRVA
jgi:hypothetical protein